MIDDEKWIEELTEDDFFSLSSQIATEMERPLAVTEKKIIDTIRQVPGKKTSLFKKGTVYFAYGVAAIFIVIISTVFAMMRITHKKYFAIPVIKSNIVTLIRNSDINDMGMDIFYKKGDIILTSEVSTCTVALGTDVMKINPDTMISFIELKENRIQMHLEYGEILIQTNESAKRSYEVSTVNTSCIFGSCILFKTIGTATYVALYKGKAQIAPVLSGTGKRIWTSLLPGEYAIVDTHMVREKKAIPEKLLISLMRFYEMTDLLGHEKDAELYINTNIDVVSLYIDNIFIQKFDDSISLILTPGTHTVKMDKPGCISFFKQITLTKEKPLFIDAVLIPENGHIDYGNQGEENEKNVQGKIHGGNMGEFKEIYQFGNRESREQNRIIGFAGSDHLVVAVTQTSLVCFNGLGKKMWETTFTIDDKIFF